MCLAHLIFYQAKREEKCEKKKKFAVHPPKFNDLSHSSFNAEEGQIRTTLDLAFV